MTEPQLRSVVPSDVDALTELFLECFNGPPWNDGWSQEAARDRLDTLVAGRHFRGYVAVLQGRLVGMLLGQKERWVRHYHYALQEMCVRPSVQRAGFGTRLVQHAIDELRTEHVEKVYLITSPDDVAEAFYGKLGFYKSRGRIVMALPLRS